MVQEIKTAVTELETLSKTFTHAEPVTNYKTLISRTKRSLAQQERFENKRRAHDRLKAGEAEPADNLVRSVHHTIVAQICDKENINISASIFEAKLGIRVACLDAATPPGKAKNANDEIQSMKQLKTLHKSALKQLKSTGQNHLLAQITELPKLRKIQKDIKKSYDAQVLTAPILPDEPWANRIYTPELYVSIDNCMNIFTTHHCVIEARMILTGSENIVGFPYGSVPGDNFAEKRQHVMKMTIDEMQSFIVTSKGFAAKMNEDNDVIWLIPSGFIIIYASNGCSSLRWGVSSDDADNTRVVHMLEQIMASLPETRAPQSNFFKLHEFMTAG